MIGCGVWEQQTWNSGKNSPRIIPIPKTFQDLKNSWLRMLTLNLTNVIPLSKTMMLMIVISPSAPWSIWWWKRTQIYLQIVGTQCNGTLTSLADAENLNNTSDLVDDRIQVEPVDEVKGASNGKRKRCTNQCYATFWRHYNEESERMVMSRSRKQWENWWEHQNRWPTVADIDFKLLIFITKTFTRWCSFHLY